MNRLIFVLILLFAVTKIVTGQKSEVTRYDVRDGLPQSQVTSLLEDELGYLWMGTRGGGLSYFDGVKFKSYTRSEGLASNLVLSLSKAKNGDLLIGGGRGVSRFDGQTFKNYESGSRIQKVFEYYDTLFCFDLEFNLTKIYKDSVWNYTNTESQPSKIKNVFDNNNFEFYIITARCELFRHNSSGVQLITLPPGLKPFSVHFINGRTLLVSNQGIFRLTNNNDLKLIEPRINFPVVLLESDLQRVWFKYQSDLVSMDLGKDVIHTDTLKVGANSYVGLKDNEGITWLGTNGRGLIKIQPSEFERIEGVNDFVLSILKTEGKLWVGTNEDGLYLIENDEVTKHFDFKQIGGNRINSIREDSNGIIWVATNAGLAKFDHSFTPQWFTRKNGLPGDSINDIEFDGRNNIWLTFRNGKGAGIFDGKKFINYDVSDTINPGIYYEMVYVKELDRMYLASDNSVVLFKDGGFERLPIPLFRKSTVYSLDRYKDDYLIIGSSAKGIALYNFRTDSVKHYTRPDGPSVIYFIGTDPEDYVWLGNDMGIARLNFNENLDVDEYLHFGKVHGEHNHEASFGSLYLGPEEKYFGLSDGLYRFIKPVQTFEQPLHLTAIDLFYGEEKMETVIDSSYSFFHLPLHPVFPSSKNHLTFRFSKINKLNPESVTYQYILEGFEDQWAPPTRANKVTYSNIPPGRYVFKVKSRDKNGLWTTVPIRYEFSISQPFYKTTVFLIFIVILAIAVILSVVYLRVKYQVKKALEMERIRQEEKAKLRKEIGRDFHDEMGNQLARIINYAGLIRLNGQNSYSILTKVEESAKDLITGTKDFIWALDPVNDSVSNLFAHAKDFGERLFKDSTIEFRAFYNILGDSSLGFGFGRQINLILKESMTNAYKHAKSNWVDLIFTEADGRFIFEVVDDGVGITEQMIRKSDGGVSNIIYRASKINGTISITNDEGTGTRIKLIIENKQITYEKSLEKKGSNHRR